jgi:hypothetical protein
MLRSRIPLVSLSILAALIILVGAASAQQAPPIPTPGATERAPEKMASPFPKEGSERIKEGRFEITVKSPDSRRISADELVRDPDLSPGFLYRVRSGGYLAFDEAEWVDKIEFKAYDIPLVALDQYKKLAKHLADINSRLSEIRTIMASYGQTGMRLLNICGKKKFDSFSEIDKPLAQHVAVYRDLIILRDLVVNSLNRLARERTCVDRYDKYNEDLEKIQDGLTKILKDYDRLRDGALEAANTVKSDLEGAAPIKVSK